MLEHRGYRGHAEFDGEAGVFQGEVLDTRDVITFQGTSVEELERALRESLEGYLEFCRERNEEPDRSFSGRLMLRLPPDLHRRIHIEVKRAGQSINQWIADHLAAEALRR